MAFVEDCEREVRDLHDFFAEWYAGDHRDAERLDRVLARDFELVAPGGATSDRDAVVEWVEENHGQYASADPPFTIDIESFDHRLTESGHCLVTYVERQTAPEGSSARLSSALFRRAGSTPNGVAWVHLHETWLDE
jgi:hypothetical protein